MASIKGPGQRAWAQGNAMSPASLSSIDQPAGNFAWILQAGPAQADKGVTAPRPRG